MPEDMEDQVFQCQMKIMAAMVGYSIEINLAALTGVTGALIGANMPHVLAVHDTVKTVALGIHAVAIESANGEADYVQ